MDLKPLFNNDNEELELENENENLKFIIEVIKLFQVKNIDYLAVQLDVENRVDYPIGADRLKSATDQYERKKKQAVSLGLDTSEYDQRFAIMASQYAGLIGLQFLSEQLGGVKVKQ